MHIKSEQVGIIEVGYWGGGVYLTFHDVINIGNDLSRIYSLLYQNPFI